MGYCSQGTTNNDCKTAQTYCNAGKQLVSQNNINATLSNINIGDLSTATIWNQFTTILTRIKDFGNLGTRNPPITSIENITGIDQNLITYYTMYNSIIAALQTGADNINSSNGSTININTLITKSLYDSLQNYINNYKLNTDRCAACNTSCNATCYTCQGCYGCCTGCNAACQSCYHCQGCNGPTYECSICHDDP